MRSTIILLLLTIGVVLAEIVLAPSNTVVLRGEKMKMTCLTNNNSRVRKWDIFTTNLELWTLYSANKIVLHKRFNHFGVEVDDNGSGVVYTNSTDLSDAGIYKCLSVTDGQDHVHSAQLTVLESLPVCESNLTQNYSYSLIDSDKIWIKCNINYRGFWSPSMKWSQHGLDFGSEGKSVIDGIETIISPRQSVTSKLTIAVNSSTNGSYFSCKIYFAKYSNTKVTTADNVPNFTYTWNSTQFFIAVTSSTTETSTSAHWWLTAGFSSIAILSICVGIVTISICIVKRRKFKPGSNEKSEEPKSDSNPDDYKNVITNENPTIEGSHTATYMELTSTTQAPLSVYASIDIAGKKLAMPSDPSPVYENMTHM